MADFLHEGGVDNLKSSRSRRHDRGQTKLRPVPEVPRGRRRSADMRKPSRADLGLGDFIRDFKSGLSRLHGLTERLVSSARPKLREFKADRPALSSVLRPEVILRHMPPSISKLVEREIRFAEREAPKAVVRDQKRAIDEYRTRVQQVVQQHLPQVYAAILRAEREVKEARAPTRPATVALRPSRSDVRALMRAATAIRSGRLPFLPKETRQQAQALLERIWGRTRTTSVFTSRDAETRRLIQEHRLIPMAVREQVRQAAVARAHQAGWRAVPSKGQPESPPPQFITQIERDIMKLLPIPLKSSSASTGPVPIAAHDIPRLQQQGVPAFQTQGVAAGGSYVVDPGEAVHVITKDSSPLVQPGETNEAAGAAAPVSMSRARGERAAAGRVAANAFMPSTAAAPRAVEHHPPVVNASRAGIAGQAATAQGMAGGGDRSMQIEGNLRIPGLADWIAKVEGRLRSG